MTKRVTKPMIASGERPIWMEAKGLPSVKEQDWYWEYENRKGNDGLMSPKATATTLNLYWGPYGSS